MDLATQARILALAEDRAEGAELVVLLGAPDAESAELSALTVISGDPTFAGPLAGVQLELPVYHVLEEVVERAADFDAYDLYVGLMADVLPVAAIRQTMADVRARSA